MFITKDHDLGRIVFRDGAEHDGLLLLDDLRRPEAEAELIISTLGAYADALQAGAFLRASASGVRLAQ